MNPSHASRLTHHASRFAWLYFGAIILLYASLSFYQIDLPGLHYDEAFEAVPALQLWQGQAVSSFRSSGLILGGRLFPLMTQDYIGALNTYAAIPFIALLGATPAALRVMSILTGAITLGLTYLLAQQLSGERWAGLIAALLLAVDPTFIFWNRQGIFVTAITAAIGLAATLCWLLRIRKGGWGWTAAGAFFLGLGLYAKLLFLWLIAALAGAVILLNLFQWLKRPPTAALSFKTDVALAIPAFLAGCWPLLVYNFQTGGTFLNVSQNAATSYYGVNNLAFGPNLLERLSQFGVVLDGSHLWYLGQVISNPLPALVFGLVLIGVVITASLKRPAASLRTALFPFLVIGLVIAASIGTVSALWVTHFALLMPWPALAIALGSWFLSQKSGVGGQGSGHGVADKMPSSRLTPHASRLTFLAGLGLLVITNFVNVIRYHGALAESGGLSSHSDAIYDLSSWLDEHTGSPVVAMDWGLAAPVTYLTGGRVTPTEVFGYWWESDTELTPRLQKFIAEPATLYLWRAPDEIIFDRSPQFKTLYRPLSLEETIEAAFYERSGRPILGITRLVTQGTATNAPK
ncbi:MAG: phospholipid carrier-dependent glycosyltransferase [Anaerolineales bacterium]|nr:phospholipid carrier-dependent glycosyltransferase [Anaerolineales bacterium]